MDLVSNILYALVVALLVILTRQIIPWIKAATIIAQQEALNNITGILVCAAEQIHSKETGMKKMLSVKEWLRDRGFKVDIHMIEAAVYRMKKNGTTSVLAVTNGA